MSNRQDAYTPNATLSGFPQDLPHEYSFHSNTHARMSELP